MNYNQSTTNSQLSDNPQDTIYLPSLAPGFRQEGPATIEDLYVQYGTKLKPLVVKRSKMICAGALSPELNEQFEQDFSVCPECGAPMYSHGSDTVTLKHITFGGNYIELVITRLRRACSKCAFSATQRIPFQDGSHRITIAAKDGVLLAMKRGSTIKKAAIDTGINRNIVMELHKAYLKECFTDKDGKLIKPEKQARYLAIDEWKLHDGNQYATIIIDLESGHILWIQDTKKADVVKNFIAHVGDEFMRKVKGIASDMNADFARAFKRAYDHLEIIYDRFHLIKNFNEKVVTPVRIAEEKRLKEEGRNEEAAQLKRSRYILTSSRETLAAKDQAGTEAIKAGVKNVCPSGQSLFTLLKGPVAPKNNRLETYESLIKDNKLFVAADIIKEQLKQAYCESTKEGMLAVMNGIVSVCNETGNSHFKWFARMIKNHLDGIVSYAVHKITSGKCEGTVNLIKSIRRTSYGFKDTDYFFLRLLSASRGGAV